MSQYSKAIKFGDYFVKLKRTNQQIDILLSDTEKGLESASFRNASQENVWHEHYYYKNNQYHVNIKSTNDSPLAVQALNDGKGHFFEANQPFPTIKCLNRWLDKFFLEVAKEVDLNTIFDETKDKLKNIKQENKRKPFSQNPNIQGKNSMSTIATSSASIANAIQILTAYAQNLEENYRIHSAQIMHLQSEWADSQHTGLSNEFHDLLMPIQQSITRANELIATLHNLYNAALDFENQRF